MISTPTVRCDAGATDGTSSLESATAEARVLLVEDVEVEAELIVHQLQRAAFAFCWQRVETEGALRAVLKDFAPTIVLSDFSLPQFDGLSALQIVREQAGDTPFVFVSGTIGEERAIEALHRGASDYIIKTNLKRLVPAVNRAINEANARRERRAMEQQLRDIVTTAQDWIWELDAERRFVFSSDSVAAVLGYSPQQIRGTQLLDHLHEEDRAAAALSIGGLSPARRDASRAAYRWRHRDGHYRWLEHNVLALFEDGRLTGFRGAERDVTERREQEDRIARLTRVLQMLSGINSLVPRIRDRKELLQEVCRFAVKTGGYAHAVVMLRKSGAQPVQPAAWFGIDEMRTDMLCAALAENARHSVGIAGRVMQDGTVFVSNDIAAAGLDSVLHAGLVQAGCRSVVAAAGRRQDHYRYAAACRFGGAGDQRSRIAHVARARRESLLRTTVPAEGQHRALPFLLQPADRPGKASAVLRAPRAADGQIRPWSTAQRGGHCRYRATQHHQRLVRAPHRRSSPAAHRRSPAPACAGQ